MPEAIAIQVDHIDHLVLTVRDVEATCAFYHRVLGMEVVTFEGGRKALKFGAQKFNLHQAGAEFEPKAVHPTPGSADLCLVVKPPLEITMTHLVACGVTVEVGPVIRTGAVGTIRSVYIRDPDGNLIELANYES